jgi:hypothetical protein
MLGILALGLTFVMIYTLVKNALIGLQLSPDEKYDANIELIVPFTSYSVFFSEPWFKSLGQFRFSSQIKIHFLVEGHPSFSESLSELERKFPFVHIHHFLVLPPDREPIPWMFEQIKPKIVGDTIIIGDPEIVGTEQAFLSIGKLVSEKQKTYFFLPQTAKLNLPGEAISLINPTLALASVFGFRRIRKNFSNPLLSISDGWMCMPISRFKDFDWSKVFISSWKEALTKVWEIENKTYLLAFGEKQLLRYYSSDLKIQINNLKNFWSHLWINGERSGFWLYIAALFIWSFPILCLMTHPFWSLASLLLLILYRFFTKIVFQESWMAMMLHPFACLVWVGSLIWWATSGLKIKNITTRPG